MRQAFYISRKHCDAYILRFFKLVDQPRLVSVNVNDKKYGRINVYFVHNVGALSQTKGLFYPRIGK